HPGLSVPIPAKKARNEKQSAPGHRSPGSRDEPVGTPLWPAHRRPLWRALPPEGADEGGRCSKDGGSFDLGLRRIRLPEPARTLEWSGLCRLARPAPETAPPPRRRICAG